MWQRLENRAEAFFTFPKRRLGSFGIVDISKRDNEAALRGWISIEANPAPPERLRTRLNMYSRNRFNRFPIRSICFCFLYFRKNLKDTTSDNFVRLLGPHIEGLAVSEDEPFLCVHREDRLSDRVEYFGKSTFRDGRPHRIRHFSSAL